MPIVTKLLRLHNTLAKLRTDKHNTTVFHSDAMVQLSAVVSTMIVVPEYIWPSMEIEYWRAIDKLLKPMITTEHSSCKCFYCQTKTI